MTRAEPPSRMAVVALAEFGGPEVLVVGERATPSWGPADVLVRVAAVSVGRLLDLTLRAGRHPHVRPPLPHVLGAEHAGTIAAVGAHVDGVALGDHVAVFPAIPCGECRLCADGRPEACPRQEILGVHRPGAYAEYAVVPAANVHRVPADLAPATAAGLALSGPVAANQLAQVGLRAGQWVLVQGAASALGSLTAAYATHLGARVIGTSRSAWKRERLAELGVVAALDPHDPEFVEQVLTLTGGEGVDVVVDDLGEPALWERGLDVLAVGGAAVSSGAFLGGRPGLDLRRLYVRNQRIFGVRTGNPASVAALWDEVGRGFRPVVDRTFPVAHAAAAHRHLEADGNMGRVVLTAATPQDWRTA